LTANRLASAVSLEIAHTKFLLMSATRLGQASATSVPAINLVIIQQFCTFCWMIKRPACDETVQFIRNFRAGDSKPALATINAVLAKAKQQQFVHPWVGSFCISSSVSSSVHLEGQHRWEQRNW